MGVDKPIVQIFEPFEGGGHPTSYIRVLLGPLSDLLRRGLIERVVVTISPEHRQSAAYEEQLSQYAPVVQFDQSPSVAWGMTKAASLAFALMKSVRDHQTDYLILTTADLLSVGFAGAAFAAPRLPATLHSVAIFHKGYRQLRDGGAMQAARARVRDELFRLGRRISPWSERLIVNPIEYERLRRTSASGARWSLLADPIDRFVPMEKSTARRMLGIPTEGRYIGCIGSNDNRKAIPELLAAFRKTAEMPDNRILLAGKLDESYRALIKERYGDLVSDGRLVLIDRYLSIEEFRASLSAIDVSAIVYYPGTGLSANLLRAACGGRPLLASTNHYSRLMVESFRLGWLCELQDEQGFREALRFALEKAACYRPDSGLERLAAFHDPENFARRVLSKLYERIGVDVPPSLGWDWVLSGEATEADAAAGAR